MKSQDIRKQFLDFFKSKKHQVVSSAPMVLKDDPTLMFTNSGMAPFKEYFLGNSVPKNPRISDTQKCLRVSGKHNDLEEVGYDTYHHTMFEMLGNWSFGDYFKKEAIDWSWELLTKVYKISEENLYVTVFEGDKKDGTSIDIQALELWKNHVSEDRILKGDKKDNFWEMGEQGPCGPSSEIHIDLRSKEEKEKIDGKSLVNKDHPQVVEIWNLVFMQFNRKANGSLEDLPKKHIDTGMGFERLCMVLQNVTSTYDTDVFTPLIDHVTAITKTTYGKDKQIDIAIRVVVDHIRAVAFAIADGQLPGNTGAGYVIRRILRRAIRYGFTFLGQKTAFIYKLTEILSDQMGDAFPEIKKQSALVEKVIQEEENSFLRTLEQGLVLLDSIIMGSSNKEITGEQAFKLYDTFGFPFDLTALIAKERGFYVDQEGFDQAMKQQKDRSRSASASQTSDWNLVVENPVEEFIGYDNLDGVVKVTRYRKVSTKKDGDLYHLVFDKTPFYPEGGGQVGDNGFIKSAEGEFHILDTKKENNVIIHFTKKLPIAIDADFYAQVDKNNRFLASCNHTATHLMHLALRKVVGTHIEQKGSLVATDHLRFDFSHFQKVTKQQLEEVENIVNDMITKQIPKQEQRDIPKQEAINSGAMAYFGDKYGDFVRVITFGDSKELDGGTHVDNTSEIWHFKIKSESAVASGIRRVEAITNNAVRHYYKTIDSTYYQIKNLLKNPKDSVKSVQTIQADNVHLRKQVEQLLKEKAKSLKSDLKNQITNINGINFIASKVDLDAGSIKNLLFELAGEVENLFAVIAASPSNEKAILSCYISKDLVARKNLNAGTVVRELGKHINGGGGGQAFFATAGGKKPEGIVQALEDAKGYIV